MQAQLLFDLKHAPQRFPDRVPEILRACAGGELTAWVMTHGTHFERVAWAAILIEAAAEDDAFLTHAEMVELFGTKWADQFRRGLHRLQKKIARHFGDFGTNVA